jgi:hypothetical protein
MNETIEHHTRVRTGKQCPECFGDKVVAVHIVSRNFEPKGPGFQCQECEFIWKSDYYPEKKQ